MTNERLQIEPSKTPNVRYYTRVRHDTSAHDVVTANKCKGTLETFISEGMNQT